MPDPNPLMTVRIGAHGADLVTRLEFHVDMPGPMVRRSLEVAFNELMAHFPDTPAPRPTRRMRAKRAWKGA